MLSGVLALLGYSCSDEKEDMYGTPVGTYEVKGTVSDAEGNPVSGAKVASGLVDSPVNIDSTLTNSKGEYALKGVIFPTNTLRMICTPSDKDMKADTANVELKFKGGDGSWNRGSAEVEHNFTVRK